MLYGFVFWAARKLSQDVPAPTPVQDVQGPVRAQDLIAIQEKVKEGEITINDAEQLFQKWQRNFLAQGSKKSEEELFKAKKVFKNFIIMLCFLGI